jgi:hypothetical protein
MLLKSWNEARWLKITIMWGCNEEKSNWWKKVIVRIYFCRQGTTDNAKLKLCVEYKVLFCN